MSIAENVTHGRIYQSPNAYIVHTYMPTFNTYFYPYKHSKCT